MVVKLADYPSIGPKIHFHRAPLKPPETSIGKRSGGWVGGSGRPYLMRGSQYLLNVRLRYGHNDLVISALRDGMAANEGTYRASNENQDDHGDFLALFHSWRGHFV